MTITGWDVPDSEFMDIFIDQLKLKLYESYRFLNFDEIEYDFRHYRAEDYGKKFNLNIFDVVLEKYLKDRKDVDQIQETQKEQIYLHNSYEQSNDELEQELLDYSKRDYSGTKIYLLPNFLYDNLVKLNRIDLSEEAKIKKFNQAIKLHEKILRSEADTLDHEKIKEYNTFVKLKERHFEGIDKQLTLILDSLHKKIYVTDYFAEVEKESTGHF